MFKFADLQHHQTFAMYSLNKTLFLFQLNENKIQSATTRQERRRVIDQQRNVEASRESIKTTVRVIVDFVVQVTLKIYLYTSFCIPGNSEATLTIVLSLKQQLFR
jgi:hypothetical protein